MNPNMYPQPQPGHPASEDDMTVILSQSSEQREEVPKNLKNGDFGQNTRARHRTAKVWHIIFQVSTVVGILALIALLYNITIETFGFVAVRSRIDPVGLAVDGVALEDLTKEQLIATLEDHISKGVMRRLERDQPFVERSRENIYDVVLEKVVELETVRSWTLPESLLHKKAIEAEMKEKYPDARLEFRSWINWDFIKNSQSSTPARAGVYTALLGTLWMILITMLVAFPLGVGAAIYLEEYAADHFINRLIETNISNLAGVPSIIYGMLGLAIFVRTLEPITSGALFGITDPTTANGRTILSASLTMALLILPVIIINAREAIRAVPQSLRAASYALGATKWQTTWYHVLPNALPGILTGTILAVSRAIGETAPLVVVGASTFIALDPSGPFSKFTALPIQVYQWTARPQDQFRNIAAAAILVLLILLIALNATAVLLRNRFSRRF